MVPTDARVNPRCFSGSDNINRVCNNPHILLPLDYISKFNIFFLFIIIEKSNAKLDLSKVDYKGINDASGYNLIKLINKFPQTVVDAYEKVEPCFIVRLLMDMASEFNKFYTNNRIIDNGVVNMNNLAIVYATKIVFENGFKLVNIPAITKM